MSPTREAFGEKAAAQASWGVWQNVIFLTLVWSGGIFPRIRKPLSQSSRPKAGHTQATMPCSPGTRQAILATPMVYGNQGQKTITCLKAGLATSWLHVLGQPLLSLGLDFVICKGDKDALAALEDWGPVLYCPSPQLPQHPLPCCPGSKPVDLH